MYKNKEYNLDIVITIINENIDKDCINKSIDINYEPTKKSDINKFEDITEVLLNRLFETIEEFTVDSRNRLLAEKVGNIWYKIGCAFPKYKTVKANERVGPKERLVSNYKKEPLKGNKKEKGRWYHFCKVCNKYLLIYNANAYKNGKDGYSFVWDSRKVNKGTRELGNFINTCKKCESNRRNKIVLNTKT